MHPALERAALDAFEAGANARVNDDGEVHGVVFDDNDGLPVPACRIGVSGWNPRRLKATFDEVSCHRAACKAHAQARAAGLIGRQMVMFELTA